MPGPLEGLRVIDLTHIMAGPACCLMLADMGADVVKVEKFPGGDDTRRMVPPTVGDQSAAFMMMNRNKRGIALDIKAPEGREILTRLLEKADVLVENFRPGTLERLGFGRADLDRINPALISCSLTGFGLTGPYAQRGGFDLVAQAMSGIMSVTGEGPGRPPVKTGPPVTDITAGILAAMGILAAYTHRLKTGKGQAVDTSLFEAGIALTYWQSAMALATGAAPTALGSAHPLTAPYQAFEAADGWLVVGGANQTNWLRLVEVLEAPELAQDGRFADSAARLTHRTELEAALTPLFHRRTVADWLERLERIGVPAGPVNDINRMLADPQTRARDMVVTVEHATQGPVQALGLPVKFSDTPGGQDRRGAPVLGQHTREVLRELGYTDEDVDTLAEKRVVHLGDA